MVRTKKAKKEMDTITKQMMMKTATETPLQPRAAVLPPATMLQTTMTVTTATGISHPSPSGSTMMTPTAMAPLLPVPSAAYSPRVTF